MTPQRPRSLDPHELGFTPRSAVPWLSPLLLLRTGLSSLLALIFGAYLDKRELQGALPSQVYRHEGTEGELWLDYVADLGDGFDATYSVASLLARPSLSVRGPEGELSTRRGRILIMGGDEVYPAASSLEYKERTVGPYRAALPFIGEEAAAPHLFAIPG